MDTEFSEHLASIFKAPDLKLCIRKQKQINNKVDWVPTEEIMHIL